MEDYKNKYEDALKRAKEFMSIRGVSHNEDAFDVAKELSETIFPELAKSDDERIRKELLEHCKNQAKPYIQTGNKCPQIQSWIDWLEKQGKKVCDMELRKIEQKQKLKIKKAKWYVCIRDLYDNFNNRVFTKGDIYYSTKDETLMPDNSNVPYDIKYCVEHYFHLWTIQDAKHGDILVNDFNIIFIFKEIKDNLCISYCYAIDRENGTVIDSLEEREVGDIDIVKFSPATKEQQCILLQKIKEEGYEWDLNDLILKKIDPDNISEDQEQAIHDAIFSLNEQEGYITKLTKMFMEGVLYEKNKNYENDLYICGYLNGFSAGIQEAKREFREKYYHVLTNIND